MIPKPNTTTAIKLASIAVHAAELADQVAGLAVSPMGMTFVTEGMPTDARTILSMMADPEVKQYLDSLPSALLPVRR